MTEQQSSVLTQRLERLEQEVRQWKRAQRWWKLAGSGAVVALVAVLLVGATGSKVAEEVRGRKFVVVDREGKIRAAWGHGVSAWGPNQEDLTYTGLIFYGAEADSRVKLGIEEIKSGTQTRYVDSRLSLRQKEGYADLEVRAGYSDVGVVVNNVPELSLSNIDRDKN